ncbi:Photosynthetic NDH subunit of subcomplex B 4, chloroplastic [Glycine soja]|uniref:Photosynthetic NDH subunit of subcomplex B 4, chloroplastic n=1 Tax=Glycine soja TaxID=3848 RepID=A0A445KC16_GLYSO|nr:Photosynthetic NDH subunit of subcomplex B 4, chloroplastic [Glycine soja]
MAESILGFTLFKSHTLSSCLQTKKFQVNHSSRLVKWFFDISISSHASNSKMEKKMKVFLSFAAKAAFKVYPFQQTVAEGKSEKRGSLCKVNGLPDWPLMAIIVEQMEGQRDLITEKTVSHLSDRAIKNVYSWYIMFTVWGCLFFGAMKDPYYDSETYRGDGGDGTGNWIYEKVLNYPFNTLPPPYNSKALDLYNIEHC